MVLIIIAYMYKNKTIKGTFLESTQSLGYPNSFSVYVFKPIVPVVIYDTLLTAL